MDIAAYVALLLLLSYFLVKAADLIEDTFVLVAKKLGITPFAIGFVVLSLASSLPEMSLAVSSSIGQVPGLSLGNLIGATIILLTLVVSINAIKHKRIEFTGKFGRHQILLALGLLSTQIIVVLDGSISTLEGLILIGLYGALVVYIVWLTNSRRRLHEHAEIEVGKLSTLLIKAAVGTLGLIILSRFIVDAAIRTAELLDIAPSIIGLVVLAIGTNIPELVISIRSKSAEAEKLAVGNFIGSASINTAILGFLAILSPYEIHNLPELIPSLLILGTAIALFAFTSWSGKQITRDEGLMLLGVYLGFLCLEGFIIYQTGAF